MSIYTHETAIAEINHIIATKRQPSANIKHNKELVSWIDQEILKLYPDNITDHLAGKIYLILHPDTVIACPFGNKLKYNKCTNKYVCRHACKCTQLGRENTNLERYGKRFVSQVPEVRKEIENTCLEIYGNKCSLLNSLVIEKGNQTKMELYETLNMWEVPSIVEKRENTNLERYKHVSTLGNKNVRQKGIDKMITLWGKPNPSLVKEINDRQVTTRKENCMKRMGVTHESKLHITPENRAILDDKDKFSEMLILMGRSEMAKWLGVGKNLISTRHKKFGLNLFSTNKSCHEIEIAKWLKSNNIPFISNTRKIIKPKELDFYFPELNLAIEFQGDYWHANPKKYSADDLILVANIGKVPAYQIWERDNWKIERCKELWIELITIWEKDWLEDKNAILENLMIRINTIRRSNKVIGD